MTAMLPESKEIILDRIFPEGDAGEQEKAGALAALRWIENNTRCYPLKQNTPAYKKKIIDIIHRAIKDVLGVNPDLIYTKSRKRNVVYARARAFREYQEITGSTLNETTDAFRSARDHATFIHLKKMLENIESTYPDELETSIRFQNFIQKNLKKTLAI